MKNINHFRAIFGIFMLTTLVVFLFSSCFLFEETTIPVAGTWELIGSYGTEEWIINQHTISYDSGYTSYTAEILDIGLNMFNAGDTEIVSLGAVPIDDYGFAIIKYTAVSDSGTGEIGRYNIFRWQDNADDPSKKDFTQGYKDADGISPYVNEVFDSARDAQLGATNAQGYFSFTSNGASKILDR
jgi:hypothetical protein